MIWKRFISSNSLKKQLASTNRCSVVLNISRKQTTTTTSQTEFYDFKTVDLKWYNLWQTKLKEFNSQEERQLFSMIFPPPNVTGNLHLGHAITSTIQDAVVRWKLMRNHRVVWIPGYDHAGIATQVVVEKKLWNDAKQTRLEIGKEKFIEEVYKWKEAKQKNIREQLIKLNALLEWDYEYFTMDEGIVKSVNEAFVQLYEKDLIYRALRPINWCCSLKSAISDAEVENLVLSSRTYLNIPNYKKPVEFGVIYKFAYPIQDSNEEIVVATTRPETMFGDKAIAVHPSDERYLKYHGKKVMNPLTNEAIPIIIDSSVDTKFHTGAVKITPAHDFKDYETGVKHNLELKTIFGDDGCLKNVAEEFMNLPRFEARYKVIEKLKSLNLWRETKNHEMVLPLCSRSGDVIEPMLRDQWFVRASKVFEICDQSVKTNQLKLIPKFRNNLWEHYVRAYTTKDWCISRQLWWGQRIPAFKCAPNTNKENYKWFAAHNEHEARLKARQHFKIDLEKISVQQDSDVFDTWFSSTLLPLAIFGWPWKKSNKQQKLPFDQIYPTNLLETGYDIMFFWAFRMVGMCHTLSGKLPFSQILFHGLIRDSQGRKMSKSIGNVIDPVDLIDGAKLTDLKQRIDESNLSEKEKSVSLQNQEKMYPKGIEAIGSDATRIALLVQDFKTDSINIDMNFFTDAKRYCNKIWQAVRYFQMCVEPEKKSKFKIMSLNEIITSKQCRLIDAWIINKLSQTIKYVDGNFRNEYDLHLIVKKLREFYYGNFCDFYLESSKPVLKSNNQAENFALEELVWNILRNCNYYSILMYHPFMPSITEEIWQRNDGFTGRELNHEKFNSILDNNYPKPADLVEFQDICLDQANQVIHLVKSIIYTVLSNKSIVNLNERPKLLIKCSNEFLNKELKTLSKEIMHLAKLSDVQFDHVSEQFVCNTLLAKLTDECEVYVKFENPIDIKMVLGKFQKSLDKYEKLLKTLKDKMSDENYELESAENKAKRQQELVDYQNEIEKINKQIEVFSYFKKN